MFQWVDYEVAHGHLVDSWLDAQARAMTGIEDGWDQYWASVREDAVNFPGCEDYCKVIYENGVPFGAICFGIFQHTMTISEIVVDPKCRGMGRGSRLLTELVEMVRCNRSGDVNCITAVVFPQNAASQKAFLNAGFRFDGTTDDGVDLIFSYYL